MINSNYRKKYNSFREHPLAPVYFKYIDTLISRDINQDVQHLLDIADSPVTEENTEIFTYIAVAIVRMLKEDNPNVFEGMKSGN